MEIKVNFGEKMIGMMNHNNHFCEDYLKALENEREKIQVFRRELPLCLQLVTQAIEACKQQLCNREHFDEELCESDDQIVSSKLGPIVGDFFPISTSSRTSSDEQHSHQNNKNIANDKSTNKKSDWLISAQLWNQYPDNGDGSTSSGAFHPFKREKRANYSTTKTTKPLPSGSTSSSAKLGDVSKKERESKGKARRSWSHELHKLFLHALQQLGGSHVATPKQIREVMKVDGLTNDEVKSHLQKYRLHERRPNTSLNNNNQTQAPQFLVVGGIWVPPPEYPMVATTPLPEEASRSANRVYAPVAAPPPHHQYFKEKRCGNDTVTCNSPDNSPITHTTTSAT